MPVPSSITDLSTTAASNSPAGTDPISNSLDDYLRAIQAIIRSESLNKSWEAPGHTATWLSATQFTVQTDLTGTYRVGRRLKATLPGPTTAYSTITASAFAAGVTTVTVANDSTVLSSPISAIEVGPNILALAGEASPLATRAWIQALLATTAAAGIVQLSGTTNVNAASPSGLLVCTVADLRAGNIVQGTVVASSSGTTIDFTGIPSWAKRVTIMFNAVSTNGTSNFIVQAGSGSVQTSGYSGSSVTARTAATSSGAPQTNSSSFNVIAETAAANTITGSVTLQLFNNSNTWVESGVLTTNDGARGGLSGGAVTLSGALDRVRISTSTPDTFDGGSFNLLWE